MDTTGREVILHMVNGNEAKYFDDYWRKSTLFAGAVLPHLRNFYTYDRFVEDYRRLDFHKATLVITVDQEHDRKMERPQQIDLVEAALSDGKSVVVQALEIPAETLTDTPEQWRWFVGLHKSLCDYLLPVFPRVRVGEAIAAVDIFCTSSDSCSGGHYDTGDVFYFALDGEKEWTVELVPNNKEGLRLAAESGKFDLPPSKKCAKITVRPGDCLYVPPFTYHRVCSRGKSLAVSVGLPTFTETTFLMNSLVRIKQEGRLYGPLPSFPREQSSRYMSAQQEVRRRLLAALALPNAE
jgi:ribosomal protein L16 Arg81 hydroxylase